MPVAEGGGIFVSYRRQDIQDFAGRLYDRLAERFGADQVFMDVDTIEPGADFVEAINRAVAACTVLLAVIGPKWLTATDEQGRRRLDNPDDFVRLEIEAALTRDVRVIPVLAQGAIIPGRDDLPESLVHLARRNALSIRHESFRTDAGRLVTAIERVLAAAPGLAIVSSAPEAQGVRSAGNAAGETAHTSPGPARNDLARVTPLLADAEDIARSIIDKSQKAWALQGVAAVLATTNPDRAEDIARSITNETVRASALCQVAKVVAATNPYRAEDIARSIIEESEKARALYEVAKAATNPEHAARLLTDVESIARSITDKSQKAWALSRVAEALAITNPEHAAQLLTDVESIVRSITDKSRKARALSRVVEALAATDPDRAEDIARSITDEPNGVWAPLREVAKALAATDPDRAEDIARSITDEYDKESALSEVWI
jgi:hypothetical protein